MVFNFFPKGVPIPPSGPSKRHNSVVDSTPHN
ncbi:protein IDA [Senna tora]|uniref:Protein IDA n=1 Tax=Senna tora TaxID=362788 RepID=A0A834SQV7_9FABA|nr:protein IDA [Senna tora]